jgi:hypothetical protein
MSFCLVCLAAPQQVRGGQLESGAILDLLKSCVAVQIEKDGAIYVML